MLKCATENCHNELRNADISPGYTGPMYCIECIRQMCMEKTSIQTKESAEISETLNERGKDYGAFKTHAIISQNLKLIMHQTENWNCLSSDQKECLDMIAHKIGRILNGNPDYLDSWRDQIGYLQLVMDILEKKEGATDSNNIRIKKVNGKWV